MINVGKMDQRVTIKKRIITYEKGVKKESWDDDYYSCWAEFLDLIGNEKYLAYQSKLENSIKFKCRTCKELRAILFETKEYKLYWKNEEFDIKFVDTLGNSKTDIVLQVQKVS